MTTAAYQRVRLGRLQTVRRFSDAEDALITQLRVDGHGTVFIASELLRAGFSQRSQATVNMRLKSLAAREEAEFDQ